MKKKNNLIDQERRSCSVRRHSAWGCRNAPLYTLHSTRSRGFTLYYAVLIGSVLLLIGASLLNLSLKEFLLSAAVRESEYAFFAADSGIECALRWDLKELVNNQPVFQINNNANGTDDPFYILPTNKNSVKCNGVLPIAISVTSQSPSGATTDFSYNVGASSQYCVKVQVIKNIVTNTQGTLTTADDEDEVWTTLNSRGYNFACSDTSVNTRKVERALTTLYPRAF